MLSKSEFVRRILDGVPLEAESNDGFGVAMIEGFDGFDVPDNTEQIVIDARFAQLLIEESGFGHGETLSRSEVVLGEQKANRFLPHGATYWAKTMEHPFHILLFELELKGSAILGDKFFRQHDQLEDALHRIVQDALEGFERGGEGRTADRKRGTQTETLCVVSVVDDRKPGLERHIVCFGTKCTATDALEVFTLREEARDWDRPLAEEHLGQLFERHFKRLGTGARWQDAFVSGEERKKARKLMDECALLIPDEKQLQTAIRELLDEIAGSFGLRRKGGRGGHRLVMHALPEDHSIAVAPEDTRQEGFKNPFQGLRIFDADERLIGYIVYVLDKKSEAERLHRQLAQHNHFHNVLVVYPEKAGATLELWQGTEPLRGRLISGTRRSRFDGEGGVVQLLSRFFVVSRSAIGTPGHLATELAWRAQHLKALAIDELHKEEDKPKNQRPLRDLLDVFNQALATLNETQFADAYAQTITYGLLAARWLSSDRQDVRFARKNIDALLPSTSPFLHDLFQRLVNSRFDQNLSWLLDDITSLLSRTMVAEVFQGEQDPSIHFYQDFLDAYDPQIRKNQGVYYTPDEVVSYIVRTAHGALQERFGLELGLADTTSWTDFAKAATIDVPEGVDGDEPFVQVLDPATGTGTFLLRVIEVIHETMMVQYEEQGLDEKASQREWVKYVRAHLLPRINGFELMMAPYIVSHLRLGLALQQTGFVFGEADRLRVFLTNALEPKAPAQLEFLGENVAEEAEEAMRVKTSTSVTTVLGNPPYQRSPGFRGDFAEALVKPFKDAVREERNIQPLSDDYILFISLGDYFIRKTGCGILGMVTNGTYLSGRLHRGLREHLMLEFDCLALTDLHGSLKVSLRRELEQDLGDARDENVFEIQQGVAIIHAERHPIRETVRSVIHADVIGHRQTKLDWLSNHARTSGFFGHMAIEPTKPMFLFTSADAPPDEYESYTALTELFAFHNVSGKPGKDDLLISFTKREVIPKLKERREQLERGEIEKPTEAERKLAQRSLSRKFDSKLVRPYAYRPGDSRWTYYDADIWTRAVTSLANQLDDSPVLLTTKIVKDTAFAHVWVTRELADVIFLSATSSVNCYSFPLKAGAQSTIFSQEESNLNFSAFTSLGDDVSALAAFDYIYAILHSPEYRRRYSNALRHDFPRIPTPSLGGVGLFARLSELGAQLRELHLFEEDDTLTDNDPSVSFVDGGDRVVSAVGESGRTLAPGDSAATGRLRINKVSYFDGVPLTAWGFTVGGYQLLHKWLSDRKKVRYALTDSDLEHFKRLVRLCVRTLALMAAVDAAVEDYGGWPAAFTRGSE